MTEDDNGLGTDNDLEVCGSEIFQELIGLCLDRLSVRLETLVLKISPSLNLTSPSLSDQNTL